MTENEEKILNDAVFFFGKSSQVDICIEEMSELIKELLKDRRFGNNKKELLEEIADVAIMLQQICLIFDKENEIEEIITKKINRLEKLLFRQRMTQK